jgi:hypothetical protein
MTPVVAPEQFMLEIQDALTRGRLRLRLTRRNIGDREDLETTAHTPA